jgi:hypothetical protein
MQSATPEVKGPRRPLRPVERRLPVAAMHPGTSWLGRWLGQRQPTTYQRCLAIHIYYAGPRSALS